MTVHPSAIPARFAAFFFTLVLAVLSAMPDARAARRDEGAQVCENALAQYRQGIAAVEQNSGVIDADMALAQLRQAYLNNALLHQLIALQILQWYNCDLPKQAIAKLPELNFQALQGQATGQQTQKQGSAISETRLKTNRGRVVDMLREVATVTAVPAACAGSASFAASDIRSLYDFLYQVGYGTADIDYFSSQYDKTFTEQLKVTRASIRQSGFDSVCSKDMSMETRRGFEKMDAIKQMFR
ncbi:MAG: hypothetical protein ACYC1L_10285 [Alphaproteobacteria bacterium]